MTRNTYYKVMMIKERAFVLMKVYLQVSLFTRTMLFSVVMLNACKNLRSVFRKWWQNMENSNPTVQQGHWLPLQCTTHCDSRPGTAHYCTLHDFWS